VPFAKAKSRGAAEIEKIALGLLSRFYPAHLKTILPTDVEKFFEDHLEDDTGIVAGYKVLPEGCEGITDAGKMRCFISEALANHADQFVQRRRFRSTIAHELGHCYLHVSDARTNKKLLQVFEDSGEHPPEYFKISDMKAYEDPEWQAWRFASALLMPEPCFRLAVDRNWTKAKIKHGFDVNPSFVEVRIRELRIAKRLRQGAS
jgi:hypothetical protein